MGDAECVWRDRDRRRGGKRRLGWEGGHGNKKSRGGGLGGSAGDVKLAARKLSGSLRMVLSFGCDGV